jgi:hypothetical protein
MRVKLLLALAIASLLLFCSTGVALAMSPGCGAGCDCGSDCQCTDNCACANGDPNAVCDCAHNSAIPSSCGGIPTAAQLTAAANNEIGAFGFPDLGSVGTVDSVVPADCVEAATLTSPLCGVCGQIPPCSCADTETVLCGPQVNLGCPLITTYAVPVNLVSPTIRPVFPSINVAPQYCLGLPQVNTQLNCFDIACQPVTNINSCPVCPVTPRTC